MNWQLVRLFMVRFLCTLIVVLSIFMFFTNQRHKAEHANAHILATEVLGHVTIILEGFFQKIKTIEAFMVSLGDERMRKLAEQDGFVTNDPALDHLIENLRDSDKIRAIQLQPNGINRYAFPYKGNESSLGVNVFDRSHFTSEACYSKDSGSIIFEGPVAIEQGGNAIIARNPIYYSDGTFWGFASIILDVPGSLSYLGLEDLSEKNYAYEVVFTSNNESSIVASNLPENISRDNTVHVSTYVVGKRIDLYVAPMKGWSSSFDAITELVFFLIISALIAALLTKNRLAQLALERSLKKEKTLRKSMAQAYQNAEQANMAKSSFLSAMSHDIRTPMNAIVGLCVLLKKESHNPQKVENYVQKITASSQHLLGIINDILDMSKIESGKVSLNIHEFSLASLIDGINTIVRPQARAKHQTFEIITRNIEHEHLIGDDIRINQILLNLLSNAVKYTQQGGTISFVVTEDEMSSANIARFNFEVIDNGMGMSKEFLEKIFDPFVRDDSVAHIQGSGLGMAITHNLIQLMSGNIKIRSKEGAGTAIKVSLLLKIKNDIEGDKKFFKDRGIERVLVLDDDPSVCGSVSYILHEVGIEAIVANDADSLNAALEKSWETQHPINLILLDLMLHNENGLDIARRLKAGPFRHIPIYVLTSYDYSLIELQAMDIGICAFLVKPFFLSNFKQAIATFDDKPDICNCSIARIAALDSCTDSKASLDEEGHTLAPVLDILDPSIIGQSAAIAAISHQYHGHNKKSSHDILEEAEHNGHYVHMSHAATKSNHLMPYSKALFSRARGEEEQTITIHARALQNQDISDWDVVEGRSLSGIKSGKELSAMPNAHAPAPKPIFDEDFFVGNSGSKIAKTDYPGSVVSNDGTSNDVNMLTNEVSSDASTGNDKKSLGLTYLGLAPLSKKKRNKSKDNGDYDDDTNDIKVDAMTGATSRFAPSETSAVNATAANADSAASTGAAAVSAGAASAGVPAGSTSAAQSSDVSNGDSIYAGHGDMVDADHPSRLLEHELGFVTTANGMNYQVSNASGTSILLNSDNMVRPLAEPLLDNDVLEDAVTSHTKSSDQKFSNELHLAKAEQSAPELDAAAIANASAAAFAGVVIEEGPEPNAQASTSANVDASSGSAAAAGAAGTASAASASASASDSAAGVNEAGGEAEDKVEPFLSGDKTLRPVLDDLAEFAMEHVKDVPDFIRNHLDSPPDNLSFEEDAHGKALVSDNGIEVFKEKETIYENNQAKLDQCTDKYLSGLDKHLSSKDGVVQIRVDAGASSSAFKPMNYENSTNTSLDGSKTYDDVKASDLPKMNAAAKEAAHKAASMSSAAQFASGFSGSINNPVVSGSGNSLKLESVLSGKRILAAEDNELNAEILVELLKMRGAQCEVCANGYEIVNAFQNAGDDDYDFILMDVQMPRMNGLEATKAIRSLDKESAKTIPIIAMTANAFSDDVKASLDAGMNCHISKPLDLSVLENYLITLYSNNR